MIVVVAEINEDDPTNVFIVDLDKLPDSHLGFRIAVANALARDGSGTVDLDDSFSYGEWCEEAIIGPPCHIDAVVQLFTPE